MLINMGTRVLSEFMDHGEETTAFRIERNKLQSHLLEERRGIVLEYCRSQF